MSTTSAIAAVTAALRELLRRGVAAEAAVEPTTLPLDFSKKTNDAASEGGVNLFLFSTQINAAFRNSELPRQTKPGETGQPPLALDLYYLITIYEPEEKAKDVLAQRLLGRVMATLHDHPLLGAAEIDAALAGSGLPNQIERIRITPHPLSVEELSKLWVIFQTEYRLSVAYQVSVVLIDSNRATRTPLPVLARGRDDTGITSQPNLTPQFPTITELRLIPAGGGDPEPLRRGEGIETGGRIALLGFRFAGTDGDPAAVEVTVRFKGTAAEVPVDVVVPPTDRTTDRINLTLPPCPAGTYGISALITPTGKPTAVRQTNEWPVVVAPRITTPLPLIVTRTQVIDGLGDATVALTCAPAVQPSQRATLAIGDREVPAEPHPTPTNTLTFVVRKTAAGDFRIRLRVDGVDSRLLDWSDPARPKFDETRTITFA